MTQGRIVSREAMTGAAFQAQGRPSWWARAGKGGSAEFLELGKLRGDSRLAVRVEVPDGITHVLIGCGKGAGAIRETVKVDRKVSMVLYVRGGEKLTHPDLARAELAPGFRWHVDGLDFDMGAPGDTYIVHDFQGVIHEAAEKDPAIVTYQTTRTAERMAPDALGVRLATCRADVARLTDELALARAALAHVEGEVLQAAGASGMTIISSTDAQG